LKTRGTAKVGESGDFKKVSDLRISISDEVIEELKVRNSGLEKFCLNLVAL